ncbi:MAG: MBL fold metallo-hydrolase [Pseudomonadota bacterium]
MELTWYGHAAFRLKAQNGTTIITDPYTPEEVGYAAIKDSADLVIISSDDDTSHCRADLLSGQPEVINALDVALDGGSKVSATGVSIEAIAAAEWIDHPRGVPGQNGMYKFEVDGLRIAHMGDVGNPLTDEQIAFFQDADVLLALAGGYLTIELPDLMEMIHAVKPKLIIPMHFRTLTFKYRNMKWIESFLDHFKDENVDFACNHTITLSRADLPETTRVLVLDYVR